MAGDFESRRLILYGGEYASRVLAPSMHPSQAGKVKQGPECAGGGHLPGIRSHHLTTRAHQGLDTFFDEKRQ